MLHHIQSVPMLDETSALHGNIQQRNDEEGGKQPRLSFSPAASVWGQMGRAWTTGGRNVQRITESITEKDYVALFHQFFGLTINPALAPLRTCHAPVSGTSWVVKVSGTTSTPASIMVLIGPARTTMSCWRWSARICNDAGFATTHKWVLTSEGNRRADLEIRNIRVAQHLFPKVWYRV
jgi:hypothetical protein